MSKYFFILLKICHLKNKKVKYTNVSHEQPLKKHGESFRERKQAG